MDSEEEEIMRQMKEKMTTQPEREIKKEKGTLQEKNEQEFFDLIKDKKEKIIAHFYHDDFVKCKAMN